MQLEASSLVPILNHACLKAHNSLAFAVKAEYFARATSVDELKQLNLWARAKNKKLTIIGEGSNLVLKNNIAGLVVKMAIGGKSLQPTANSQQVVLNANAGESWSQLVDYTTRHNLYGMQNMALIPGLAGAAPVQNIGAYGQEIKDILIELQALHLPSNSMRKFSNSDCEFAYRHSIFKRDYGKEFAIVSIKLALTKNASVNLNYGNLQAELADQEATPVNIARAVANLRRKKLPCPKELPNAGSFFKNPIISQQLALKLKQAHPQIVLYPHNEHSYKVAAAWLIEHAGFKGYSIGKATVYKHHALVLLNQGEDSAANLLKLAAKIKQTIWQNYQIDLEIEPQII